MSQAVHVVALRELFGLGARGFMKLWFSKADAGGVVNASLCPNH